MKIRIKTNAQSDPILRHMAEGAGISLEQLAEVALYNLMALYVAEKGDSQSVGDLFIASPPSELSLPNR